MTPVIHEAIPYRPEADTFDVRGAVRRIWSAVFGHKLVILACCAVCVGLVLAYIRVFPPVFVAGVLISIEGDRPGREFYYLDWNLFRKGDAASESELMTGAEPSGIVVDDLGLTYDDVYHSQLAYLRHLWQESTLGKQYKALKAWLFPRPPSPYELPQEVIDRAETVQAFRDSAHMEWVPGTDAAYLIVRAPTPQVADYANRLIDAYLDIRQQRFIDEADAAYRALAVEVAKVRADRDRLIEEKRAFEEANGLSLGFEKDRMALSLWGELRTEIHDLEIAEQGYAARLEVVNGLLAEEDRMVTKSVTVSRNSVRELVMQELVDRNTELMSARQHYRPDSREIRDLEKLIGDLERSLEDEPELVDSASTREVNNNYLALRDRQQELMVTLAATKAELEKKREAFGPIAARLDEIPALIMKNDEFEQEMKLLEKRYEMLLEKFTTAEASLMAAQTMPATIQVIERANPPFLPSSPKTKLLLIGALFIGLLGGAGLAVFVEVLNGRVTRDRLSLRSDMPVYATIEVSGPIGTRRLRSLAGPIPQDNAATAENASEK